MKTYNEHYILSIDLKRIAEIGIELLKTDTIYYDVSNTNEFKPMNC